MTLTKPKLFIVPIEPLNERYTEQWYRRLPQAFTEAGFDVEVIDGATLLYDEIRVGSFLDINSTVHYKASQIQVIAKLFNGRMVPNGSVFFFSDLEFWGVEVVRLLADMNKVKVKLAAFLHAASYTREDAFEIAAPYQQYTEVGWIAAMDKVLVGSAYHKRAVISRRLYPAVGYDTPEVAALAAKLVVTGNPLFLDEYGKQGLPKKKKVLLTNRFDIEKRPNESLQLFATVKRNFPEWEFVVTTGRKSLAGTADTAYALGLVASGVLTIKANLTKRQYHQELEEAAIVVSHSVEENFGYCLAEAVSYGCVPFYRDVASHTEILGTAPYCLFRPDATLGEQARGLGQVMHDFDYADGLRSLATGSGVTPTANWYLQYTRIDQPEILAHLNGGLGRLVDEVKTLAGL